MSFRSLLALCLLAGPGLASAGDLTVSAASSLTDAFRAVSNAYEAGHPGTHVLLNVAASDVLLRQIVNGAPADVFASADQVAMDKAVAAGVIDRSTRHDFASNRLVLIVPKDASVRVRSPADLRQPTVRRVAYGDPASVPVGRYTQAALQGQGLWDAVSAKGVLAQNVRQSLDYVARGEVDAGFVFATDAAIMKNRVDVVAAVPTPQPIRYPIAVVAASAERAEAVAFSAFVQSAEGQRILASFGFQAP